MDLERLYGGSFVSWEGVAASWAKGTVASRMLAFAARRYLDEIPEKPGMPDDPVLEKLPPDVARAFAAPPERVGDGAWGAFMDAALAAEFEMLPYGERPPVIAELRAGLARAAEEAGEGSDLGRWFLARRAALPGSDLPDGAGYLPI